jgi:hypothetical protein
MKKFVFPLHAVKTQREIILDQKLAIKAKIIAERDLLLQNRMQLEALYQQTLHGGPQVGQAFNSQYETWRQLRLFSLRDEIKLKDQAIAMVDHRLELAQQEVSEAHKNMRAMEILEEKARDTWEDEYRKEEQKNTDEINMQRFGR